MKHLLLKIGKAMGLLLLLYCFYVILSTVVVYMKHPDVSDVYKAKEKERSYYGDVPSSDRAYLIEDNTDALIKRLQMIQTATDHIILSTFDFRSDESGTKMLAALSDAADRGVNVRILVDGFSDFQSMNHQAEFYAIQNKENIEIKIYNKINLLKPWKLMGRMHDKYLVVDDSLYILGGRNTSDFSLEEYDYMNYDRDVLVYTTNANDMSSSIHQIEDYFEEIWNAKDCKKFAHPLWERFHQRKIEGAKEKLRKVFVEMKCKYPELEIKSDYEAITVETNKITLLSNPTHPYAKEPKVFYSLFTLMQSEGEAVDLHTPYIICNDAMYEDLSALCEANSDVRIMTNSTANNGNPFGASDYELHVEDILETGVDLYEYEGGVSYHGKSIVIGESLSLVGSYNLDIRSTYLDTELMLVIDSEEINRQLTGNMQEYEKESVKCTGEESYEVPENVIRQEISGKRKARMQLLKYLNVFRFLM